MLSSIKRAYLNRDVSLGTTPAQMSYMAGLSAILGAVGGVAAYLVVHTVGLISNLALLHRVGFNLPDLRYYHASPALIPIAVAGGVVVALLSLWSPVIKGHGIPESIQAIMFNESRIRPRAAVAKPLSAAVAMGTGGPFGAEGPIIVMGGSVGSLIGQLLPVSPAQRRILLACGAAAGMTGVFGTPLAAIIMAFELLVFERSLRSLVPLMVSTAIADTLHSVLLQSRPLFAVEHPLHVPGGDLWLFVVLGVAVGGLAVVLNKVLAAFEMGYDRLALPSFWHPVIGAVGFALVGLVVPGTLSVGYWAITDAVNGRFLLGEAAALCLGKALSWWIALGSNTSGGTLAPMFLIGATMGEMMGVGFANLFPGAHLAPAAFALAAMGATFGVGARAPLTGVVFAAEVTGDYAMIVPLLVVTAVADLLAEVMLQERIMTDRLARRGLRVEFDAVVDIPCTQVADKPGWESTDQARPARAKEDLVQPPTLDPLGQLRSTRSYKEIVSFLREHSAMRRREARIGVEGLDGPALPQGDKKDDCADTDRHESQRSVLSEDESGTGTGQSDAGLGGEEI